MIYIGQREADADIWFGGAYYGGDVDAVYAGDELVWPDVSGYGGYIRLSLPAFTTEGWRLLSYAMGRVALGQGYVYFKVGEKKYYVGKKPTGSTEDVVEMRGNYLLLTTRQRAELVEVVGVGDALTFEFSEVYSAKLGTVSLGAGESKGDTLVGLTPSFAVPMLRGAFQVLSKSEVVTISFRIRGSAMEEGGYYGSFTRPTSASEGRIIWEVRDDGGVYANNKQEGVVTWDDPSFNEREYLVSVELEVDADNVEASTYFMVMLANETLGITIEEMK